MQFLSKRTQIQQTHIATIATKNSRKPMKTAGLRLFSADGEIRTLAPVIPVYSLSRGCKNLVKSRDCGATGSNVGAIDILLNAVSQSKYIMIFSF